MITTFERSTSAAVGTGDQRSRKFPSQKNNKQLSARPYVLLSTAVITLAALGAALKVPFTHPEGDFWDNVQDYLRTGHVTSTLLPDTYPFVMGHLYHWEGARGVIGAQVLLYLLVSLCSFLLLRLLLHSDREAALGALVVSLNPDLLSSISKLWDTLPACLGLMGFTLLCLRLYRGPSRITQFVLAVFWGFSVSIRPNFALLIVPVAIVLWPVGVKRWIMDSALIAMIGFGAYAISNTLSHGSFYLPLNGPYNLFAGANPYAEQALLHGYNGETGIDTALHAIGVNFHNHRELWLTPIYESRAFLFIRTHPVQWLLLMPVKLLTLLRPDLKAHQLASDAGIFKVLTSLWVPTWLLVLAFRRKHLRHIDITVIAIAALYVLPFLLTNSDPRFRVPLDTLALVHTISLLLHYRTAFQRGRYMDAGKAERGLVMA